MTPEHEVSRGIAIDQDAGSQAGNAVASLTADVAIVGYAPVGRLLALILGRLGWRVFVVERQQRAYPLPRAVHFDDEVGRILQSVGLPPDSQRDVVSPYDDVYEWRAADRQPLLRLDWRGLGPSGWHVSNFFHQPRLEDAVTVDLRSASDDVGTVTARYVIGADGANSLVRSWIGSTVTNLGYFHDWLVIDLLPREEAGNHHLSPPAWQLCDPARPTTLYRVARDGGSSDPGARPTLNLLPSGGRDQ